MICLNHKTPAFNGMFCEFKKLSLVVDSSAAIQGFKRGKILVL